MASALRVKRKVKIFDFEGDKFGIRPATVDEQTKIQGFISDFQRSIKKELALDKKDDIDQISPQQGDPSIMTECQKYIVRYLVVDPAEPTVSLFGIPDAEKVENLPADFLREAWFCYSDQNKPTYKATNLVDVFGEKFVKDNAIVNGVVVELQIARLELEDPPAAHKARIALDLVKPEPKEGEKPQDPPQGEMTTSSFGGPSSSSPSSIRSTQET